MIIMMMVDPLLRVVHNYLDDELNENALFLAERLQAFHPAAAAAAAATDDNSTWIHLRALACLRLGRYTLASELSRKLGLNGEHVGCSYVFAQSCLQLKNYADGVAALTRAQACSAPQRQQSRGPTDERSYVDRFLPDSSSIHRLLGKLHRANGNVKAASVHFSAALEADPFMWDAFTNLCDSGVRIRVSNIFKLRDMPSRNEVSQKRSTKLTQSVLSSSKLRSRQVSDTRHREPSKLPVQTYRPKAQVADENVPTTESENGSNGSPASGFGSPRMNLPVFSKKRLRSGLAEISAESPGTHPEHGPNQDDVLSKSTLSSTSLNPQRRSARLLNQRAHLPLLRETSRLDTMTAPKRVSRFKATSASSGRQIEPQTPTETKNVGNADKDSQNAQQLQSQSQSQSPLPETNTIRNGTSTTLNMQSCAEAETISNNEKLQPIIDLLQKLGTGYYHLSRFQPKTCLEAFTSLPVGQQATPWVLSKTGRAQYELMSYKEAKVTFQALRKLAPSWLEDIEIYSTVLWHLKEDIALAFLSHELSDSHYLVPQTWCTMGNLFSLQRSRQEAIKCFRRACQLSPRLPHSFSLLGYEYMEVEEFNDASLAFQQALLVDPRHYSAWVGLGRVQERLGQGEKALEYYLGAQKINDHNAVLLTYIARVLDRIGKRETALNYIHRGIKLDPPMAVVGLLRMQAAGIYLRSRQPMEAVRELRLVERMAADEPRVHFLLGKAYAMAGPASRGAALQCYTVALSLAPWSDEVKMAMADLDEDCSLAI